MEMEKVEVLIPFLLIFRQSGDVLFFLYARRLRGYTATTTDYFIFSPNLIKQMKPAVCRSRSLIQLFLDRKSCTKFVYKTLVLACKTQVKLCVASSCYTR